MKQIKYQKELIGKTIAQVIIPKEHYDDLWIKFTDGSFVVFDVSDISSGYESSKYLMSIEKYAKDMTDEELVELGLISPQEHTNDIEEREKRWAEERKEREREDDKHIKKHELELLDKLKNKYPDLDKDN